MKGLYNFGNTCYINSILQIIIYVYNLPSIIHTNHVNKDMKHEYTLLHEIIRLYKELNLSIDSYKPVKLITAFINLCRYNGNHEFQMYKQCDAYEFLETRIEL